MVKWKVICKSKRRGGLGIKDLRRMNISLLCKWWWKLEKENGLWQQIIIYRYMQNKSIHNVGHKLNDSPIGWNYKPAEKHYWLIFCERKILFRLKKQAE
jgi:hypothetical protein